MRGLKKDAAELNCYGEAVAKLSGILFSLAGGLISSLLGGSKTKHAPARTPQSATARPTASPAGRVAASEGLELGRSGPTATVEVTPREVASLHLSYNPRPDGTPDPGEIVWTWVPFEENDGRGKDRPVLVVGRLDKRRVIAFALTSKQHSGQRDYLPLGTGDWDREGRPSWIDLDRVLRVDEAGMRREGAVLDRKRFGLVAGALAKRYGWSAA